MWNFNDTGSLNSIKNSSLKKADVKIFVQLALNYIDSKQCPAEQQVAAINRLWSSSNTKMTNNQFAEIFAAVLGIVKQYMQHSKSKDHGKKDILRKLLQEHKFPDDCLEEVCNTLWKHNDFLLQKFYELKTVNVPPAITWRINISALENTQMGISEPTIILEIVYPDGKVTAFEMSRFMFHRLRYSVSQLLKSMHAIEGKAIVKK